MSVFRSFYVIIVFVAFENLLNAQNYLIPTPDKFYLQVKQFNEFIDRFNYKTDFKGEAITKSFPLDRQTYIKFLVDYYDPRFFTGKKDSIAYQNLIDSFSRQMVASGNPFFIEKFSSNIHSWVNMRVRQTGKEQDIVLHIIPEKISDGAIKWSILDIIWPSFIKLDSSIAFVPPNANETNFIILKKLLANKSQLGRFSTLDFKIDKLSIFLYEVALGNIEILYTNRIVYIVNIDKWEIEIREFTRSKGNTGWLISNIIKH
jgi:hypothetical protein